MDNPAKLLIQFPTRERPQKFLMVAKKYMDFMEDKKNWIMNVSCDDNDFTMNDPKMINKIYDTFGDHVRINFNPNKNKHEACNADISSFTFDIVLLASDDMIPKEVGYDNIIRKYFSMYFPNFDGVLHFDDGHQHDKLNTLSILGRKYYDRFGYIYNQEYISLWADAEFDMISRILGKRKYIERVIIKHEHPNIVTTVPYDELYRKNDSAELHDRSVFFKRKAINFNL
jgi:hypothetical protein